MEEQTRILISEGWNLEDPRLDKPISGDGWNLDIPQFDLKVLPTEEAQIDYEVSRKSA